MVTPLWKTKTFWVGILAMGAGLVQGIFDGDWGAASTKLLLGAGMITGRDALRKLLAGETPTLPTGETPVAPENAGGTPTLPLNGKVRT